jgi:hypothetical protein
MRATVLKGLFMPKLNHKKTVRGEELGVRG